MFSFGSLACTQAASVLLTSCTRDCKSTLIYTMIFEINTCSTVIHKISKPTPTFSGFIYDSSLCLRRVNVFYNYSITTDYISFTCKFPSLPREFRKPRTAIKFVLSRDSTSRVGWSSQTSFLSERTTCCCVS